MGRYADAGASKFSDFISGMRAAQNSREGHITAIGHSYGSVVLGEAAIGQGLKVDDIIVAGSPGMHVSRASDLGIKASRVWVEAAESDLVPVLGRYGHGRRDPRRWWDPYHLPIIPSDRIFGGAILRTDTSGHSDYWKAATESLKNQARVVAGTHQDGSTENDPQLGS